MKKNIYTAIVGVLIVVIGGFALYGLNDKPAQTDSQTNATTQTNSQITFSEGGTRVSYSGKTGKTALDILESLTEVDVQTSEFGQYVSGINGVKANASTEYWSFYVNATYANEGAGTYKTTDGEKIEWRLEQLQL